eukprot:g10132.t1
MLNSGIWARFNPWPAMGAAIGPGGYAVLIFGDRTGSAGVYAGAGQVWVKSTTMTSTITETTRATSTSTSRSLFRAADGGLNRACRNYAGHNSESFYRVQGDVESLDGCQQECSKFSGCWTSLRTSLDACRALCATEDGCKGIEFSAGRCEVWLRAGGIGASKALAGFTCMRMP